MSDTPTAPPPPPEGWSGPAAPPAPTPPQPASWPAQAPQPPAPPASWPSTPAAAPASPAPEPPQRAMRHQTEQTRTYPCASCGGQLVFDIPTQKLKCPSCGNVQDIVEDAGKVVVERDLREAVGQLRAFAQRPDQAPQLEGEKEVVCQNCGGHTTFTGTLTSTRCPYCATPIQRDDVHDAPARLPVDGVLPFQVDAKQARENLDRWIQKRWFAPTEFKKYNQKGAFNSVYAAYFTYDAQTSTSYQGQRGDHYTVVVGSGQNQRTETRTRWTHVQGQVNNLFDDVAVLANDGLERTHVAALEPWPTQSARPFSAEYVAGHLCRTYDHDAEQTFAEARSRMESEITSSVQRAIGGDVQRVHRQDTAWHDITYKHLLLPIWLLTVIFEGRPFQVLMNGVTGEVQGQRPYSKVKIAVAVVLALLVVIGLAIAFSSSGGGSGGSG